MNFVSTRGDASRPTFYDILTGALAPDGGLYLPETWPTLEVAGSYPATVAASLAPFLAETPLEGELSDLAAEAFAGFRHPEIAPLRTLADGRRLLELFWGPTLAFKDHALQVLGRLLSRVLEIDDRETTVLVATSGDTGSAAIEACRGSKRLRVVVLFPEGRVSEFQRRQMTTVLDENVTALAVAGTFDDCQDLVKRAFSDESVGVDLTAMNSINFGRVAVQAAYYLWAAAEVPDPDFVVPTGNFGNVFSGWAARAMGGRIGRFVIANNANHGLANLIESGTVELGPVEPTLAPSMDIQIPSNLERYLYEVAGRDPDRVRTWQQELRSSGRLAVAAELQEEMASDFDASWFTDDQILETIARAYASEGILLDPHTALAWRAGLEHRRPGMPQVILATADPVKFSSAVISATGIEPPLPPGVAHVLIAKEREHRIANDYAALVEVLRGND